MQSHIINAAPADAPAAGPVGASNSPATGAIIPLTITTAKLALQYGDATVSKSLTVRKLRPSRQSELFAAADNNPTNFATLAFLDAVTGVEGLVRWPSGEPLEFSVQKHRQLGVIAHTEVYDSAVSMDPGIVERVLEYALSNPLSAAQLGN